MDLSCELEKNLGKSIGESNEKEVFNALMRIITELADKKHVKSEKKKLYYISAEFLIGRLLLNNLINLGIYEEVKELLSQSGHSLERIFELEKEPSLGNGGLGRLAACFLDSIATLNLNGDGIGLNYRCGLFKQSFINNKQVETPDFWQNENNFLKNTNRHYYVDFGKGRVCANMYDLAVTGYMGRTNYLHLFEVETVDEGIIGGGISFNKEEIEKNLTLFLYPDDSDDKGRLLRLYQEYFMVSCAAQLIIDESVERGSKLYDLHDYAIIQINDTHPSLIIPELIRILTGRGVTFDKALFTVSRMCAYTNHTILAEALEKWKTEEIKAVAPAILDILEMIDDRVRRKFDDDNVYIIDNTDKVHMANLDIHLSKSVNGVAKLHTDILKESELNHFYKIYPEKFNNKTNGITPRRWLVSINPELSELIKSLIGDEFKKDAGKLLKLKDYINDDGVLNRILEIKANNKKRLCEFVKRTQNDDITPDTIFDIQAKRMHEYKRQQLNALYIIDKILKIRDTKSFNTPVTSIFAAKAAPAYTIAKDIIHLILCLSELTKKDDILRDKIRVIMIENYNVTKAEYLIPACDISEQISLASKEASGTGNMKFMLNGGITIGTEDGANVEIHGLVGDDNIYIFGDSSDAVIKRYRDKSYNPRDYYDKDSDIKNALDFIVSDEMLKIGDEEKLKRLYNELLSKDYFMTLPDFSDYVRVKDKMLSDYGERKLWAKKMLINISNAGYFSSDRTIKEYNDEIWHL